MTAAQLTGGAASKARRTREEDITAQVDRLIAAAGRQDAARILHRLALLAEAGESATSLMVRCNGPAKVAPTFMSGLHRDAALLHEPTPMSKSDAAIVAARPKPQPVKPPKVEPKPRPVKRPPAPQRGDTVIDRGVGKVRLDARGIAQGIVKRVDTVDGERVRVMDCIGCGEEFTAPFVRGRPPHTCEACR